MRLRPSTPHHTLLKFGGSFSTQVDVSRCLFEGCNQAMVNWADWTTVEKSWVTTSTTQALDTAVFENHDRLFLRDILGVPREPGQTAASNVRWVDNYAYRYSTLQHADQRHFVTSILCAFSPKKHTLAHCFGLCLIAYQFQGS